MVKRWTPIALVFQLLFLLVQPAVAQITHGGGPPPHAAVSPQHGRQKLLVAVMEGPPWSMKDEDGHWTGMTVELWREIAEFLDVDYDFKEYDLNGLQKAVEHGEVDLSAAGLAITAEREKRFDFSDPYFIMSQSVAVNADEQPNLFQAITSTLTASGILKFLLVLLLITLAGATILWLIERQGKSEHYGAKDKKSFIRSMYWSIRILSGRDSVTPTTNYARAFEIIWILVGVVMISLFTASAASLFTTRQLQSIVNSPDDLRHVRVGTVQGCAAQKILDHREIKYVAYETPMGLIKSLTERRIDAAVMAGATSAYYAKRFDNKVIVLRFSLRQDFAAIAIPPGSPLRKPINQAILKMLDTDRWRKNLSEYSQTD